METKITIIVINRQCWFLAKTNISNHTLRNKNKFVVFWTKKILQHFFIIYSYYKYLLLCSFFVLLQGVQDHIFYPFRINVRKAAIFDLRHPVLHEKPVIRHPLFSLYKKHFNTAISSFVLLQITNFGCNKNLKYISHFYYNVLLLHSHAYEIMYHYHFSKNVSKKHPIKNTNSIPNPNIRFYKYYLLSSHFCKLHRLLNSRKSSKKQC